MRLRLPATPKTPRAAVTVVIPCYRYGRYLSEAVKAALDQPGIEVRVIIVDDASPDDSLVIARGLAAADPRIRVIAHERNAGHIQTYNDGLAAVTTPYFALVSADDLVAPGALTRAVRLMEAEPGVGMVYGRPIEFEDGDSSITRRRRAVESWTIWQGIEWIRLACWRGRCFILSPEVVMRTAVLEQLGGYNSELPHSGDLEYWLRTASRWAVARINGPAQAYYRVHGANMHLTRFAGMAEDLTHRAAAFDVLSSPAVMRALPSAPRERLRARQAMAREAAALARRGAVLNGDPDQARLLGDVALRLTDDPELRERRGRRVAAAIARAGRPTRADRLRESLTAQLDRVRWRAWKAFGIS